ncbi:MAG: hypothetical protein JO300_07080, partial [Silvibacterium sp.]|nr:hypothetical protein [Silvibacterium sp.]
MTLPLPIICDSTAIRQCEIVVSTEREIRNECCFRFPFPARRTPIFRIWLYGLADEGHHGQRPMVGTRGNRLISLCRILAGLVCLFALPALTQDATEQGPELPLAEAIQIALANN